MLKEIFLKYRWRIIVCTILSAAAAATNLYLIDFLHGIAQQAAPGDLFNWAFKYLFVVIMLFLFSLTANLLLVLLACKVVAGLREKLVRGVVNTEYRKIEQAGKGGLQSVLTDDVANISEGMALTPPFIFNSLNIVMCLGYLCYLSPVSFLYFFTVLVLGISLTALLVRRGNAYFESYRELKDSYYGHIHSMFDGAKEIAVSRQRREHFLNREILPSISELKKAEVKYEICWNVSSNWSAILLLAALGVSVAVTRHVGEGSVGLTMSYFIVITFLASPINFVVTAVADIAKTFVSAKKVEKLEVFENEVKPLRESGTLSCNWEKIVFNDVCYLSKGEFEDELFHFGPVSLEVNRGEVLFVTGGNGSGKSTFGKLLVGLYRRSSGDIKVDSVIADESNEYEYQKLYSTIFSDFYLFSSLLDHEGNPVNGGSIEQKLEYLEMSEKVHVKDGYLSTTALSQGQRKRLALLQSWLEDSPVYLFDEWAADQDPKFRELFYQNILPKMKRQGKTMVVISHDDRYFSSADRIYKFEFGKLVEQKEASLNLNEHEAIVMNKCS